MNRCLPIYLGFSLLGLQILLFFYILSKESFILIFQNYGLIILLFSGIMGTFAYFLWLNKLSHQNTLRTLTDLLHDKNLLPTLSTTPQPPLNIDFSTQYLENRLTQIIHQQKALSAIFEQASHCISLLDTKGNIIQVNQTTLIFHQINLTDILGKSFWELAWWAVNPVTQQHIYHAILEASLRGNTSRFEAQYPHTDGSLITLNLTIKPIKDKENNVLFLLVESLDITKRKQTETHLRQREDLLAAFTNALTDFLFVFNEEGRYVNVLTGKENRLYSHSQKLQGKLLYDTLPTAVADQLVEIFKKTVDSDSVQVLEYCVPLHGEERWFEGRFFPLRLDNAGERLLIGISRNITERKRAELKLQLAFQELNYQKAALDHHAIVAVTDQRGIITYVNEKFCEISLYHRTELLGENHRILNSQYHSRDFFKNMWQTITKGQVWRGEICNRRKNGQLYWVETTIIPHLDQTGKPDRYTAIRTDITALKEVEKALRDERMNLECTVEERTRDLRDSLKKLEELNLRLQQANRAKAQFLSSMSHELRTPLNAVLGFTDLLNEQFFGHLNERQLSYVKQIESSGKHLLSLINDLLDLAKIDAGAMHLELANTAPEEFVSATIGMMSGQFRKKEIQINTYLDPTITNMLVDIRKCKQIMFNLLSNALKYTPSGGRVDVRVASEGAFVRFSVMDTGIGIAPEQKDKIFFDFYQINQSRDEILGGTGIGLALTRRLVELHHGVIGVDSEVGKGSTFWFILPLLTENLDNSRKNNYLSNSEVGVGINRRRILVAEDNEVNLRMLLDMLSVQNHEVIIAHNGKEAVELTIQHHPQLIFMDMQMPLLTGLEATYQLRQLDDFKDIPIIALTASTGSEAEEQQISMGCTEHVAKPVQSRTLFAILQKYLGNK